MEKKKGFSILKLLIMIICLVSIIVAVVINIAFSKNRTPKFFDRYIYVVSEPNPLASDVSVGSALISKEASGISIAVGDIVLCYPANQPDTLTLRSIGAIVTDDNGVEKYYTRDDAHEDNTDSITKDKIAAVCTGYPESAEMGALITFAKGIKGIVCMLIVPCALLLILFIAKLASSKDEEFDENYDFYEYDDRNGGAPAENHSHAKPSGTPLFEPSQEIQPSNEFERKKMSIAENFSQKEVNHDSPYQKEKERTMQFKAQRGATGTFPAIGSTGSAESSFAARNMGGQSSTAPTADALREEMLRKTAEAERTGSFSIKSDNAAQPESVPDNTGVLSKSQLAEMSRDEIPRTAPLRSQSAQPSAAPRKSSSPDISDIISKSENAQRKKSASNMSVDDLLKMIEDEKNRL